jgi:hypothetical protein
MCIDAILAQQFNPKELITMSTEFSDINDNTFINSRFFGGPEIKDNDKVTLTDIVQQAVREAKAEIAQEEITYSATSLTVADGLLLVTLRPSDCICGQHIEEVIVQIGLLDEEEHTDVIDAVQTLCDLAVEIHKENIEAGRVIIE